MLPALNWVVKMQRLAREYTRRGTEILCDIANDPNEDSRDRIVAIGMLFDRAWGKPKDYDPAAETPARPPFNPRDYTPEQLDVIEAALRINGGEAGRGGGHPAGPGDGEGRRFAPSPTAR